MDTQIDHYLEKIFYKKLSDVLLKYKNFKNDSILISIMEVKSNTRLRLLNEAVIPSHAVHATKTYRKTKNPLFRDILLLIQ